jgi:hypothetical protein
MLQSHRSIVSIHLVCWDKEAEVKPELIPGIDSLTNAKGNGGDYRNLPKASQGASFARPWKKTTRSLSYAP